MAERSRVLVHLSPLPGRSQKLQLLLGLMFISVLPFSLGQTYEGLRHPYVRSMVAESPFDHSPHVRQLHSEADFKTLVEPNLEGPESPVQLVMLYAYWCPACHMFAKIWISMAGKFHNSTNVRFNAMECAEDREKMTFCLSLNITYFPTIQALIPKIKGYPPPEAYDSLSPSGSKYIVGVAAQKQDRMEEWIEKVANVTLKGVGDNTEEDDDTAALEQPKLKHKSSRWPVTAEVINPDAFLHDGLHGAMYILRNWAILGGGGLTVRNAGALKALVGVAQFVFPGRELKASFGQVWKFLDEKLSVFTRQQTVAAAQGRSEATELSTAYDLKKADEPQVLSFDDWDRFLDGLTFLQFKVLPLGSPPEWMVCQTILCGVWTFLHTLSIGGWEMTARNKSGSTVSQPSVHYSAIVVMDVIRDTVDFFFGCRDCRTHFLESYEACAFGRCEITKATTINEFPPSLSPLQTSMASLDGALRVFPRSSSASDFERLTQWLWRLHNGVTVRTAMDSTQLALLSKKSSRKNNNDATADMPPKSYLGVDVRWPTVDACRQCRLQGVSPFFIANEELENMSSSETAGDARWDKTVDFDWGKVFEHLRLSYWEDEWSYCSSLTFDEANRYFVADSDGDLQD